MQRYFKLLFILFFSFSCKKHEGVGGKATISGKVYAIDMNNDFSAINSEYYSAKEDVYIIYGNDSFYSDKLETSYNGLFEFNNLNPGKYTIYVFSKDTTGKKDIVEVLKEITIEKKDKLVTTEDFIIIK